MSGTATTRAGVLAGFPSNGPPGGIGPGNVQNFVATAIGPSVTLTPVAGAVTWNLAAAPCAIVTITQNTTITVTGGEDGFNRYRLAVIQGGTGGFVPTFVGVTLSSTPVWNSTAGGMNRVYVDCVGTSLQADVSPGTPPGGGVTAKWFVDASTGNDSNDGLSATVTGSGHGPFLTIQHVNTVIQPGDTCSVASGTYTVTAAQITTTVNGTAGRPITYLSATQFGAKIVPATSFLGTGGNNYTSWQMNGAYTIINGFEFDGSGQSGITTSTFLNAVYVAAANCQVINCKVHDIATNTTAFNAAPYSVGIFTDSYSAGFTGINALIAGNQVFNMGPSGHAVSGVAGHGIYCASSGAIFENNLVYNTIGDLLTSYHGMQNWTVINNTCYNGQGAGIEVDAVTGVGTGNNCIIRNNIVHTASYGTHSAGVTGTNLNVYDHNNYFNCANSPVYDGATADTNLLTSDPLFTTNGSNFVLQGTSPCLHTGSATGAPLTDITGAARANPPSRGAYET